MTYPDAYDATNAKKGSDYELAMHWRQIAEQERSHDALEDIIEWVQLNHRHHEDGDDQECQCWHADDPYVDSLDLVAFVMAKRMGKP